jgi:hypothetical protein
VFPDRQRLLASAAVPPERRGFVSLLPAAPGQVAVLCPSASLTVRSTLQLAEQQQQRRPGSLVRMQPNRRWALTMPDG